MVKDKTEENIKRRPPIVAVLGHVDHGKSSLLEAIRDDFVITKRESGGITQHIGAYEVEKNGQKITFIDTPGHEAFSAMRQRGANVADIALLVIDASEGIKDQTKEAIKFIKKAGAPIIVVFNKIDLPTADPEKVKQQLAQEDIVVESYGGKIPSVEVSAKEKKGIDDLLETILLVSEMEDITTDSNKPTKGVVVESLINSQKGPVATLILRNGSLRVGDIIVCGECFAKIKNLSDFKLNKLEIAEPSQPVIVLGFNKAPMVGDEFEKCDSMEKAQEIVKQNKEEKSHKKSDYNWQAEQGDKKIFNIILKTDMIGSREAIEQMIANLPSDKVLVRILRAETGDINTNDIQLANDSNAKIFGFRVKAPERIKIFARNKNVKIFVFDIIYELAQEIRKQMIAILSPIAKRIDLAKFKITHLFKQTNKIQIIGGKVIEGFITRGLKFEILRDEEVIGEGRIKGLQQDKKEVGKVEKGKQAGLSLQTDVKVEENDILQIYKNETEKDVL